MNGRRNEANRIDPEIIEYSHENHQNLNPNLKTTLRIIMLGKVSSDFDQVSNYLIFFYNSCYRKLVLLSENVDIPLRKYAKKLVLKKSTIFVIWFKF